MLEPRRMLSAQSVSRAIVPTYRLLASSTTPADTGLTAPASNAYTPTEILTAYSYAGITFSGGTVPGNGAGQTIAIVDAYNDPGIITDANTFSSYYDLPQFNGSGGPTLTVTGPGGVTPTATDPAGDDWALETSLDVEWAHALAPEANILLVEADSDSDISYLMAAVQYATSQADVSVVSMSWGNAESGITDSQWDSTVSTPAGHQGITFVSSAGDTGTPGGYPAYSPNVLAVGGTSLTLSNGAYGSETTWNTSSTEATGGGISTQELEPSYQDAVVPSADTNNGHRAMPDVAFDADPNTGVAIVDSEDYGSSTPWIDGLIGGTSFGAPSWAALIAIADQGRATEGLGTLDGVSQTLPEIYTMPSTNLHDITTGNNNTYSATTGYDLVTGRGTPVASSVVGYLDSFSVTGTSPVAGSTVHTDSPTSFTVTFSDPYSTSGLVASDFEVNGIAATSFTDTTSTSITFNFATSPVTNQGTQTMTIAAGAIHRAADGAAIQAYSQTFNYDPTSQLSVVSTSPSEGSQAVVPFTSLTVNFNEAYAQSSINTSNLHLSQGTVTGFTFTSSTSVTYTLSGLTSAGTLNVSIAAGAITDTGGGGISAFSTSYTLTTGLVEGRPAGSLVYEAEDGGSITTGGQSVTYSYNFAAGQTITAILFLNTLTSGKLTLSGPGISGTLSSTETSSTEPFFQTVAITGGTYTFTVSSSNSHRIGSYTLDVFLNAAVSLSTYSTSSNNSVAKAQNINGSFTAIGPSATRGGVVGETGAYSTNFLSDFYLFSLTAGQTVSLGVMDDSGASGTINVQLLNSSGSVISTNPITSNDVDGAVENYTATTTGTYYAEVTGTKSGVLYVLVATINSDFDFKANATESTAQNISGTKGVLGAITASAPTDWYAINLTAGSGVKLQTYTFGSTGSAQFVDSAQPQIELFNPSGTLVASGSGSPNQSLSVTANSTGTYYVEVTGASGSTGEYFLGDSIDLLTPAVSITPISPNPTNAAVSQMQIVFNEAVSGMSLSDLTLSYNGGPNLLTGSQTLTTSDNETYTLGNLASLTGTNGTYTLTVAANSGITDSNGFALQSGASSSFTVDTTPPEVTGVYVSGTSWTSAFMNYLASNGGSATLGYLIPAGSSQLNDLPWVNINTISVVFNENVSINTADSAFALVGSPDLPAPAALSSATYTYSSATHTATWVFASPLATDKYLLNFPAADVTDSLGSTLDGEWTAGSSMYPSGNGVAGGNFDFQFNVLRGDVNHDGAVTGADGNAVRLNLLQNVSTSGYSAFDDLTGDGAITGVDGSYVRLNLEATLPATDPSPPSGGGGGDAVVAPTPGGSIAGSSTNTSSNSTTTSDSGTSSSSTGSSNSSQSTTIDSNLGGRLVLRPAIWLGGSDSQQSSSVSTEASGLANVPITNTAGSSMAGSTITTSRPSANSAGAALFADVVDSMFAAPSPFSVDAVSPTLALATQRSVAADGVLVSNGDVASSIAAEHGDDPAITLGDGQNSELLQQPDGAAIDALIDTVLEEQSEWLMVSDR
jgi:subtilase family serine protease